jgi:hypothetical protein
VTPAAKEARFAKLSALGCVCCAMNEDMALERVCEYVEIHHLNGGGHHGQKRRGDEFTIPLGPWHHRGIGNAAELTRKGGPSWAKGSKPFRAVYGTDDELLAAVNWLISPIPYEIPESR